MNELKLIDCFKEFYEWLFHGSYNGLIDLDDVWKRVGYKNKGLAVIHLRKIYTAGVEYFAFEEAKYFLKIECLRDFCMCASTAFGQYTRRRLIKSEEDAAKFVDEMEKQDLLKSGITPFPQAYQNFDEFEQWMKRVTSGSYLDKLQKYMEVRR